MMASGGETTDRTLWSRTEAAERVGCHPESLRYYERIGLMPEPHRLADGRRVYDATALARLKFILDARALHFSLEDVGTLLRLAARESDHAGLSCDEANSLARRHLADIREQIAGLRAAEQKLSHLVAQCEGHETDKTCPLLAALGSEAAPTP
ncbi:MAG: Hg(II)-responsive transcriptional regulator [Rhodothalassiaceae bacterium]